MLLLGPHETRWHETLSIAIMKRVVLAIGVAELFLFNLKAIYSNLLKEKDVCSS